MRTFQAFQTQFFYREVPHDELLHFTSRRQWIRVLKKPEFWYFKV